jgi:hypothetical protein
VSKPSHPSRRPDQLTGSTEDDALDPDDVRDVEPDAVECDLEWRSSRRVDPRVCADLPREVAQAIAHLGQDVFPRWSPDLDEAEIIGEELDRVAREGWRRGGRSRAKVTDADVAALRRDRASGLKLREVAERYGISTGHAWRLATGVCRPDVVQREQPEPAAVDPA